jgi:elongation factor Tu
LAQVSKGEIKYINRLKLSKMAKKPLTVTVPNIGTIGHVDHGKTTLTAAITKVLSDAGYCQQNHLIKLIMLQKKRRGITINTSR